ncbi:MAG: LptA/OstA family protein [Myxococcota bacterium]
MIADRSRHPLGGRRPGAAHRRRRRTAARLVWTVLVASGLASFSARADQGGAGIRIAIAPFAGEGDAMAISQALSLRVARLGVERLLAPGSFEVDREFDPRADAVRRWASQSAVDNVVVGRVERASGRTQGRQIEAAVRSGHSGAELFRHAVHVQGRDALEPALDRLASAIVRDLGGDPPVVAAADTDAPPPPVSARSDAAPPDASKDPVRSAAAPGKAAPGQAESGERSGSGGIDGRISLGDFDSDAPIEIKADEAEIVASGEGRRLVFTGSVWVHQDDLTLRSDFLEAEYVEGESEPRQLVARGGVRVEQGNRSARCDLARYERASQQITCRGHAELVQGCDIVRGELIVLDLAANKARVEGAASIVISPKQGADAQCRGAASRP